MCLKRLDFSLKKRGAEYVGIGYKNYSDYDLNDYKLKKGIWSKAKGWDGKLNLTAADYQDNTDETAFAEMMAGYPKYTAGFHIFLNKDDAIKYGGDNLYQVEYKNVIAFGTNSTGGGNSGPCIISTYMRLVKKLN